MLAALVADHPKIGRVVLDIAKAHDFAGAVVDRLIKGTQLLVKDHVSGNCVASQSDPDQIYWVEFAGLPRSYKCDCPDWQKARARLEGYGPICKHAAAVHLAWLTGYEQRKRARRRQKEFERILREAREKNERGQASLATI